MCNNILTLFSRPFFKTFMPRVGAVDVGWVGKDMVENVTILFSCCNDRESMNWMFLYFSYIICHVQQSTSMYKEQLSVFFYVVCAMLQYAYLDDSTYVAGCHE